MTRKLLFFLLGFTLPFMIFKISYASTCGNAVPDTAASSIAYYWGTGSQTYLGAFDTDEDCRAALSGDASMMQVSTGILYIFRDGSTSTSPIYFTYKPTECQTLTDSDGDGIPDANDFYPDDNTPHLVRQIGFYTEDCTMSGTKVATLYETNRGDKYYTGIIPSEGSCYFQSIGYPWESPGGPISDDDFTGFDKTKETDVNKKDIGQYNQPDTNQDPQMQDGQAHEDGDTTDQSQSKIVDNTASTAQNTKRLGDYAQSLDKALSGVNQNMARSTQAQIDRNKLDADRKQSEVNYLNQAKDEFDGVDVSSHYDSNNYSGELTEGTDYQPAPDLEEESWFTGFISNNPLKTAYDNSGFNMTSSTCTMTLTIPGLGTHTLSLCQFDQEFQTAGNLFLALTSLTALIIIAWR